MLGIYRGSACGAECAAWIVQSPLVATQSYLPFTCILMTGMPYHHGLRAVPLRCCCQGKQQVLMLLPVEQCATWRHTRCSDETGLIGIPRFAKSTRSVAITSASCLDL
eukprot:5496723-Amphidinium_carterae.1